MANSQQSFSLISSEDIAELKSSVAQILKVVSLPQADPQERVYKHKEAAEFLGISEFTLYDHKSQGRIEGTRVGNRVYYTHQQLLDYIKGNKK